MRLHLFLLPALAVVARAVNYNGTLRPQVHYSPPKNFMNDPNGMFLDADGIYHLYYQYNPYGIVADNQHWGHTTSRDLYHWTNQPIAISPNNASERIFSGSAVVDKNNTSGFFPNQDNGVVAIYTLDTDEKENQHIAYSTDGGYTFTKYANNPVIDSNTKNFRDPQVVWHPETQKWVMTVSYADDLVIAFYTSPNLREWTHASNFTQEGLPGVQFECPNLVKFSVGDSGSKHVLFISINPGAPLGGSITYYLVGNFNGTHFNSETSWTLTDFAKDNYAAQWFSGIPAGKPPVSIGWASNWQYTQETPTGPLEGWRGVMAVPRVNTLTKVNGSWIVTSNPYNNLRTVLDQRLTQKFLRAGKVPVNFSRVKSQALYFNVEIDGIAPKPTGEVNFNFTSSKTGEYLDGGIRLDTGFFWINRAGTHGFTLADSQYFTPMFNTTVPSLSKGQFTFSGVIDRSLLETFLDQGKQAATVSFYPNSPLDVLTISASHLSMDTTVHVDVWSLKSGWTS